jgi:dynein axonemal heavy chain
MSSPHQWNNGATITGAGAGAGAGTSVTSDSKHAPSAAESKRSNALLSRLYMGSGIKGKSSGTVFKPTPPSNSRPIGSTNTQGSKYSNRRLVSSPKGKTTATIPPTVTTTAITSTTGAISSPVNSPLFANNASSFASSLTSESASKSAATILASPMSPSGRKASDNTTFSKTTAARIQSSYDAPPVAVPRAITWRKRNSNNNNNSASVAADDETSNEKIGVRAPATLRAMLGSTLNLNAPTSPKASAIRNVMTVGNEMAMSQRPGSGKHDNAAASLYTDAQSFRTTQSTRSAGGHGRDFDVLSFVSHSSGTKLANRFTTKSYNNTSNARMKKALSSTSASQKSGTRDLYRDDLKSYVEDLASTSGNPEETSEEANREYQRYLKSPFSFIDRVIEDPNTEEFVYLQPIGPYQLQIVKHNQINESNYFTMSRSGVTQFCNSVTDFTSLEQWEREYFLYSKIMQIEFFRKYRAWKAFFVWKKLIRRSKNDKYRRKLEGSLYILNPFLRHSLLHLNSMCCDMRKWTMFRVEEDCTYTLDQFQQQQREHQTLVIERLQSAREQIRDVVLHSCDMDLREFLIVNGFRRGCSLAEHVQKTGSLDIDAGNMNPDDLSDIIQEEDFPQKISHAERAAIRTKCRQLTKFIRLVDQMLVDSLIGLSLDSSSQVLKIVQRHSAYQLPQSRASRRSSARSRRSTATSRSPQSSANVAADRKIMSSAGSSMSRVSTATTTAADGTAADGAAPEDESKTTITPVFSVELVAHNFDEPLASSNSLQPSDAVTNSDEYRVSAIQQAGRQLAFSPSANEIQLVCDELFDAAVKGIMTIQGFVDDDEFLQYTQVSDDDAGHDQGSDVERTQLVLSSPHYREHVSGIKRGLSKAFYDASQFALRFSKYLYMYKENNAIDFSNYRGASLEVFRNLLVKYQKQVKDFSSLSELNNVGIVQINVSQLKAAFLPSPERCLLETQCLLPSVARDEAQSLHTELVAMNEKISSIPAAVQEFVDIMGFLRSINDTLERVQSRYEFVTKLITLMDRHQIEITHEDSLLVDRLAQALTTFRMSISFCEASVDANTQRFAKELSTKIPDLLQEVGEIHTMLESPMVSDEKQQPKDVIKYLSDCDAKLSEAEKMASKYEEYQTVLEVPVDSYNDVAHTRKDLNAKLELWRALDQWECHTLEWTHTTFSEVQVDAISKEVTLFMKKVGHAKHVLGETVVTEKLKNMVMEMKHTAPVVADLRNEHLKERHWAEIQEIMGADIDVTDETLTLGSLLELQAMKYKDEIGFIATKAVQEAALGDMLQKVVGVWEHLDLPINPHKNQKDLYVLGNLEDIMAALDESLVNINTVLGSRYVEPIREEVNSWNAKLMLFQDTLDEWLACQRSWMYLETIFGSPDIVRQLPEEAKIFAKVDTMWRSIMQRTNDNPRAIEAGTIAGLKEKFQQCNTTLERVQKRLEQYLETKRMAFPRFYFLSNDELLEILAQSKNVEAVQVHLRKCFDNIVSIQLRDKDIIAMNSAEGERVPLGRNNRHTQARSSVEVWLNALESDMFNSLRRFMKHGVGSYETTPRKEWVVKSFSQVVMTVTQIAWAHGCEAALRSENPVKAMKGWLQTQLSQLSDLTKLVRGNLSKIDRKKIVALVTTDVHARDVVSNLIDSEVDSLNNFNWQQQLRFYWDTDIDDCIVRQANAMFRYGYEYMGVTSRLVITPLTDRCWMTITGALHLRFGAAPAGPAGTGKTESTKDLAKAMGFLCIVFNCSDQIDYTMMGKLFSGLAQTGAWTCLDEFNRIDIEVLSVVAQQLRQVRHALLANSSEFLFQDTMMPLKSGFGVMITMNPGYAGRTELPDNLKVLFRPVAMMIPDYALIAEIMLFAEGFDSASILSKKMVKLYKLSSEQLSQQDHYDFGMRAVKSVLVMAGALKRAQPELSEDVVLIRAMCDSNIPKFLSDDLPLFQAIVQDLFPTVSIPESTYDELTDAVKVCIERAGLQPVPKFINKVQQLYDTFNVRFGVMIVGPTGAGKSACYNMLAHAMTYLREEQESKNESFQNVHLHVMNPKCITMGELYGEVDALTQEWRDGLGSSIMRTAIKDTSTDRHWVVFDGPVDALWIENMNTVLDDNMTLCLANGERIKLKHELRMLFEVQDLAVASPATVSRCGMVYMTPADLGFLPFVRSWMDSRLAVTLPPELDQFLYSLFEEKVAPAIEFVRDNCVEPVATVDINLVSSLCHIIEAILSPAHGVDIEAMVAANSEDSDEDDDDAAAAADDEKSGSRPNTSSGASVRATSSKSSRNHAAATAKMQAEQLIGMVFSYAYVWSIGGSIDAESQSKFKEFASQQLREFNLPRDVYDVYVDTVERKWASWSDIVPEFKYDNELPYFRMLVPTVDTVRYSKLMQTCLEVDRSVFFTGTTGVGKSVIINDLLRNMKQDSVVPLQLTFSAQTNAAKIQETIESKLVKLRKTLLGAPAGKRVVIFVDDVNMPSVEEYGAQPPIELLRQFQDFKGFYDRRKHFWKDVQDTTLVCAAAPAGGGRSELTPRFVRHFNVLCLPPPSDRTMAKIFGSILDGFLVDFPSEMQKMSRSIVKSTVSLYDSISSELLPTPAKAHYTFNLRDVSKVFQGVLMIRPQFLAKPDSLVKLWIHECQRCFCDRLINDEDRLWFENKIVEMLNVNFKMPRTHEQVFSQEAIIFADFFQPGMERNYEECKAPDQLSTLLNNYLEEYNMSTSRHKMNLVFFDDAMNHIARICRILRQPRGNALLVGVGGSGKRSLTRLACFVAECECVTIEMTRSFGYADFQEQVKAVMVSAGVNGRQVAFMLNENQIIMERFLEDVNNILNSGEVPNLFQPDEMMKILDDMMPVCRDLGVPESRDEAYSLFVQRVRDNLHIVLCLSPVGDSFRVRCRKFPSLINCMTVDWFTQWPKAALRSVAEKFLAGVQLPNEELRSSLVDMCVEVHSSLDGACSDFFAELRRHVYTTPKSYLDMINLFLNKLEMKRGEITDNIARLDTGLTKLKEANGMVAELKSKLVKLQPELKKKAEETEQLLKQVAIDQDKAAKVREVVEAEEKLVTEQAIEVKAVQADAQADLDLALPALEAALKALDSLKKSDISEVKSMGKPPLGVVLTMEAVCIMLGEKADWDAAKKVMANAQFLKMLKEYDKDNISPKTVKKLKKYLEHPMFNEESMKKVSVAATSLCMWVKAMVVYSKVAKDVEPKRQRVQEMNRLLEEANTKLAEKREQLRQVNENVAELTRKCDETIAEKERLDAESKRTRDRLERSGKLTSGLATESVRWHSDAQRLREEMEYIVGDVFLSCACLSYYPAFTGSYRNRLILEWQTKMEELNIPVSEDFTLQNTLGNAVSIRGWRINGLPTDEVSTDNGVVVEHTERWPLMIDPQGQARKWIRNEYKSRLIVTRFDDPQMLRKVERAVRNGLPVLVEDVGEELDASIDVILQKQVYKVGGNRSVIRLGDNEVDYDDNFRFFMTTNLSNPHYLPEISIKVTIINFTVTELGLEDQLLGEVVKAERPDVEEKKSRLVVSMAEDRKQLKDIEDRILRSLSESQGMILDDVDLITTLGDAKFTSSVISERMKEAEETQKDIEQTREQYRSVATRGSILYFCIADLALIDPMYQYSLAYFLRLFNMCIEHSEKSDVIDTRLENVLEYMTMSIFNNICRGLFESHKTLFAFTICTSIMRSQRSISQVEWNLLLRDGITKDHDDGHVPVENPDTKVFSERSWHRMQALERSLPDTFGGLCTHVCNNLEAWIEYSTNENVHNIDAPGDWGQRLNGFQQLLLLKALREEKLLFAISDFVAAQLGRKYVEPTRVKLEDVYRDSDYKTPIVFVLSAGADPSSMLLRFAKEMKMSDRLEVISLGQGQGENARNHIMRARKRGDWVLLQNCHLAKSWMPDLERLTQKLGEAPSIEEAKNAAPSAAIAAATAAAGGNDNAEEDANAAALEPVHSGFRLWLTSMPCDYFPVAVLQSGIKITNEPPKGLRANLMRSFTNVVNAEEFDTCSKSNVWKKLLFGLTFFHAVIQERKKFGPLGWNKMYEFNDSDLETSMQVLRMFLDEQDDIPWDALRYVCGQINYGGRVTDDWDRRCLMSILNKYYTPDILNDEYTFSPSGTHFAPSEGKLDKYTTYIGSLPLNDNPEVFGMHENANLTFQAQETEKILSTVLSIQPREVAAADGLTPDELVAETAVEITGLLPESLEKKNATASIMQLQANGAIASLSTCLLQEAERYNRLLNVIRTSLYDLQRAIRGEVVMSMELDKVYLSLMNNQVPDMWAKAAYPSLKPLDSWVKDLIQRVEFMRDWLQNGQPKAFWLSGFFFPQGFLTGVLQTYARKYQVPIDSLGFEFDVLDKYDLEDVEAAPEDGVYVYGLYMDGARWDMENQVIADSHLNQLQSRMPIIHFKPVVEGSIPPNTYECPVYKTSVRAGVLSTTGQSTNFVVSVHLPSTNKSDYWVLKGAALLCQLDS